VIDSEVDIVRRPLAAPNVSIPFGARSVAHGFFRAGVQEDRQHQPWGKIMCCIAGSAELRFGAHPYVLRPGAIAVFLPGGMHWARALEQWEVRWWTIDGEQTPQILAGFGWRKEGIYDGEIPSLAQFRALRSALSDVTPDGEYRAGALVYEMLCVAARRRHGIDEDPLVAEALRRIQRRWAEQGFGVEVLARDLDIHRSALSRRFTRQVGVSPREYLIRFRIQRANALLRQSDAPIAEIAAQCGYPDAAYFSRLFRRVQGVLPRVARRQS